MTVHAAIHTGLRQLGIEGDDKRDLYRRVTGEDGLTGMSSRQHQAVLEELRRLGFKPASKPSSKRAAGPYRAILQAHWIALWNLGLVPGPSDAEMTGFVRRQTKVDHTRFLIHQEDASKVIEALKARMERDAGVDWSVSRFLPPWTQTPGYRIARAQFQLLRSRDPDFADFAELQHWLIRTADKRPGCGSVMATMTDKDWIAVMNALGVEVRRIANV